MFVLRQEEVHLDFAYNNQTHILKFKRITICSQILVVYLNLVLAEVFNEEALLCKVPCDLNVLLADGILVGQTEIVRIISSLLPANVDL